MLLLKSSSKSSYEYDDEDIRASHCLCDRCFHVNGQNRPPNRPPKIMMNISAILPLPGNASISNSPLVRPRNRQ